MLTKPLTLLLCVALYACKKDNTTSNTIKDKDGNIYTTIDIENQRWLVQNLRTTHYNNGDTIRHIIMDNTAWKNTLMDAQNGKDSGAWCYYSNNIDNGKIFGCLYNYYALVDRRGIAPEGYHVANANDYLTLINNLGGTNAAGGILKDTTKGLPQSWEIYNTKAYNSIGFTALPAGRRQTNGDFFGLNKFLNFYTPTLGIDGKPLLVFINYNNSLCSIESGGDKQYGFSVRCVKNTN